MTCATYSPVAMKLGDDKTLLLTLTDRSTGERLNLTDYEAIELQVKPKDGDLDAPILTKALGAGITLLTQSGDTLGQAHVTIDSADTPGDGANAGIYRFDVVVVDENGKRRTVYGPADWIIEDVVNTP